MTENAASCEREGHVVRSQNVGSCARCGFAIDYDLIPKRTRLTEAVACPQCFSTDHLWCSAGRPE